MTRQQTNFLGRCCSYPQGTVSFLPQVLATAAVICNFYVLPWTPGSWFPTVDFLCVQINTNARGSHSSLYGSPNYEHECGQLRLVDEDYWTDDERTEWAVQMATVFAIASAIIGSVATLLLFSAICFHLDTKTTLGVSCSYFGCMCLSLLTLIAGAYDLCKQKGDDGACERHRVRLAPGAVAEVFGAIFYLCAGLVMFRYFRLAQGHQIPEDETEVCSASPGLEEMEPLRQTEPAEQPSPTKASTKKELKIDDVSLTKTSTEKKLDIEDV